MSTEGPLEVLLVEDNPSDVKLTLHALQSHRLANRIQVVRDGDEALELLFGSAGVPAVQPRVVLLDIKLPKVDGLEVLRRIRANRRTRNLPVVLLTSSDEEADILAGYRHRANSYIVKPIDFAQFSEAVRTLGLYWLLLNKPPPAEPSP